VTITTFIVLIAGYLLGSIPFAYLLARRHRGIDLRLAGSGNVGAANLLRTTTRKIGVSAMALDMAKGIASVLVARQVDPSATGPAVAGIAAVLGHIYPVWLGFRGGKGVATTCGVFTILAPQATAIATVVFLALVWWTRYISLGSVAGSVLLAPLAYMTGAPEVTVIAAIIVAAIVVHRHRSNLRRVFAGIERRIGQSA
jgi:acyl phosphate:glycerol-3-phosphate acyltransferase